jgi:hypothetical protein
MKYFTFRGNDFVWNQLELFYDVYNKKIYELVRNSSLLLLVYVFCGHNIKIQTITTFLHFNSQVMCHLKFVNVYTTFCHQM